MTEGEELQFSSVKARIAALKQQGIDNSLKSSSVFEKQNASTSHSELKPPLPSRSKKVGGSQSSNHNSSITKTDNGIKYGQERPPLPPLPINRNQFQASKNQPVTSCPLIRKTSLTPLDGESSGKLSQEAKYSSTECQSLANAALKVGILPRNVPLNLREKEEHINLSTSKKTIVTMSRHVPLESTKYKMAHVPISNRRNTTDIVTSKPKLPPRHIRREDKKESAAVAELHNNSSVSNSKNKQPGLNETLEYQTPDNPNLFPTNPPPINLNSKPSIREIQVREKSFNRALNCLRCRDFSGPDRIASQYPRHSLPRSHDIIGYLASVLCDPFPSATDKARAIFTWLHYNIAYDVDAFIRNRIKFSQPEDTIISGLAVCSGYAGVFEAIAIKAGLEAITIVGHGKGFGYTPTRSGDPVPSYNPNGHAWNSVRIDNNQWKLIDSCWGAGNIDGQKYTPKFSPNLFTCSNEDFGIRHFPQEVKYFFRSDGFIPTWEQYIRGLGPTDQEPLQEYGNVEDDYNISFTSIMPPQKYISPNLNEATFRFQFSKVCEHMCDDKKAEVSQSVFLLCLHGPTNDEWLPFESNGYWWWLDVPSKDLITVQRIGCYTVDSMNGIKVKSISKEEYLLKKGKCSMGFSGVCAWEVI